VEEVTGRVEELHDSDRRSKENKEKRYEEQNSDRRLHLLGSGLFHKSEVYGAPKSKSGDDVGEGGIQRYSGEEFHIRMNKGAKRKKEMMATGQEKRVLFASEKIIEKVEKGVPNGGEAIGKSMTPFRVGGLSGTSAQRSLRMQSHYNQNRKLWKSR